MACERDSVGLIRKICEGPISSVHVWYLIKNPDLSIDSRSWHAVAVVVEEDSFFLGVASEWRAQFLHFVHRGVQTLLVTGLKEEGRKDVTMIDALVTLGTRTLLLCVLFRAGRCAAFIFSFLCSSVVLRQSNFLCFPFLRFSSTHWPLVLNK